MSSLAATRIYYAAYTNNTAARFSLGAFLSERLLSIILYFASASCIYCPRLVVIVCSALFGGSRSFRWNPGDLCQYSGFFICIGFVKFTLSIIVGPLDLSCFFFVVAVVATWLWWHPACCLRLMMRSRGGYAAEDDVRSQMVRSPRMAWNFTK